MKCRHFSDQVFNSKVIKKDLTLQRISTVMWAQLGLNQRPPDYESGAANQLSYGPAFNNALNISGATAKIQNHSK